ncbi:carboxymuconolactone decarboxylase family protein [Nocardioides sp. PD653]|uniref:carboxymuconolactone decarboxylase family protein n=2 Tax=unclassified Nocardioides TaxID=2615069 RepID=UPI0009EFF3BC|nr:Gamma-carboxymuconolactone decarboxylase-like protein [Nocardioides sp. PD653-B2]GAW53810.1 Gamma-carboxymuconolactone decarboxylase-like protein [Nocardioides sp. PD653]
MEYLSERFPEVADAYRDQFRRTVELDGPLSPRIRELVLLGAYAATRQPRAFALHCERALRSGCDVDEVRQAVLLTLGASATLEWVVDALRSVDEIHQRVTDGEAVVPE